MAEPHAACLGREVLLQGLGREAVVHVSASAGDAFAQVKRVGAVVEEFAVVVGFDHQVAGALHIGNHGFGELSGVGDEAESGRPSPPCGAKRSVVFVSSGSMSSMK